MLRKIARQCRKQFPSWFACASVVLIVASCGRHDGGGGLTRKWPPTFIHDPYRINGDPAAAGNCGTIMMVARKSDVGTVQARRLNGSWSNMWDLGSPDGVSINSGLAVNGAGSICHIFARGSD